MGALFFAKYLPGHDVGVVLHGGDDDFVIRPDVGPAVGLGYQIDALGGAPHEDDLLVVLGVDELPHLLPRPLVGVGGQLAQGVDAPVDVGIFGRVVIDQGIYNRLGLLGGSGVVQVHQGLAVDQFLQDGEVLPYPGHVKGS